MINLVRYQQTNGDGPPSDWLNGVRGTVAQARIRIRLRQVEAGNFGDCEAVGERVSELRVHVGASYRVYFGRHGQTVVVLLCGGDKRTQTNDIKRAKLFWADWKGRQ